MSDRSDVDFKRHRTASRAAGRRDDQLQEGRDMIERIVIVGAGMAGGRAADDLRNHGYAGHLALVGDEMSAPYHRPMVSKELLRETADPAALLLQPSPWYPEHDIDLRLGVRAKALDSASRIIGLSDGAELGYDLLLIASGRRARRLDVPGAELAGIHYLRTRHDATLLQAELVPGRRLVLVGGGFIGLEVAAAARARGVRIDIVDAVPMPFEGLLGATVADLLAEEHRRRDVRTHYGAGVAAFRGDGHVREVITERGERLACDVVVIGAGVVPNVEWLTGSGVVLDNGVVVDELCATTAAGVYAAGDVASFWHPRFQARIRLEHESNAHSQGRAAARSMLGLGLPYMPMPSFSSDQRELSVRYVGYAPEWDKVLILGDPEHSKWVACYLCGDRLVAVLSVNSTSALSRLHRFLHSEAEIGVGDLRTTVGELTKQP